MNAFTIKDLENISGIKAHTIRIWEQRYSFIRPQRSETNIRNYTGDELKIILNIALLNKHGFKISHIDKMDVTEIEQSILSLSQPNAQQERVINELIHHLIDLDIDGFDNVLNLSIKNKGIEHSIIQIIFPFLERIGILWLTNHINPAQEHLVTNVIRQKLIVGIENAGNEVTIHQSALLFLPEGEHHELGLLFMHYLLKIRGVKVFYVGANIPIKDIEYITTLKNPNFLYCHLTAVAHNFNLEKFLQNMHSKIPNVPMILSGQLINKYKHKVPNNIVLKKSLVEVMDFINAL